VTDKVFTSVQIPSEFPGGSTGWTRFLERTLDRDTIVSNGAPSGNYRVTVSFIVARDGSISDVRAENDPGYGSAIEAVRVIKLSPKWKPAQQNGHNVIYRHRQVIVFQVTDD
jgi:protein TonB